ncbi:MAG: hypothetical protein KAV00_18385 [Phycisphaerae bacterium]|nr:hypothetical protein [Phycisphaerae bacterium]
MKSVDLYEEDLETARGGDSKVLPWQGEGVLFLSYSAGVYRLTHVAEDGILEAGVAPREGAVSETIPETPQ